MELERGQELVAMAAAFAVGFVLAVVDPDRMPSKMKSWALSLGRFRQLIGVVIVLTAIALAVFR